MRVAVALASLFAVGLASAGDTSVAELMKREAVPCDRARTYCFAIQLHVAVAPGGTPGGTPGGPELVVEPAWVEQQLTTANQHFARLDAGFQITRVTTLPAAAAHLKTRAERSALGKRLSPRVIDVFITGQLDDVDEVGKVARGVTWRQGDRKFIIVSAQAKELTLAHELGHFFGLPHSTYPISIMNKTRRDAPPPAQRTFHADEYAKMAPVLRRLVRSRVIANVRARE